MVLELSGNNPFKVEKIEAFDGKIKIAGSFAAQQESNILFEALLKRMELEGPLLPALELDEETLSLQKPEPMADNKDIKQKIEEVNVSVSDNTKTLLEKWLQDFLQNLQKLQNTYITKMGIHLNSFTSQMATYGHCSEREALHQAMQIESAVSDAYTEILKNSETLNADSNASAPLDPDFMPTAPFEPSVISSEEPTATFVTSENYDSNAIDAGVGSYVPAPTPRPSTTKKRELTDEEMAEKIAQAVTQKLLEKDKEMKARPENNSKGLFSSKDSDVFKLQTELVKNSVAEKITFTFFRLQIVQLAIERHPEMESTLRDMMANKSSAPRPPTY